MSEKKLEICCYTVQSAINAEAGGAHRVELCDNLYEGGTTPSYGTILVARKKLSIKLHVIIRPRGGDFLYSDLEYDVMKKDILFCKENGVDGVVFGLLKKDGTIDIERTKELSDIAKPMCITFHRAFDVSRNPFKSMEELSKSGIDRILTSGQEQNAIKGQDIIKELIQKSNNITILPGAGLNELNIAHFANYTSAREFHMSARTLIQGKMEYRNKKISMGGITGIPEHERFEADENMIRRIVEILNKL